MRQFIASKENDKIKLFKKIASSKKYRSEYGLFPLEGVRLVEDAAMENAEMSFVIASETTSEKFPELLERLEEKCGKIIIVPDDLAAEKHIRRRAFERTRKVCRACSAPRPRKYGYNYQNS